MANVITGIDYACKLIVTETMDLGYDLATSPTVAVGGSTSGTVATAAVGVPISVEWHDTRTLAGTSETIDLTSLSQGNLPAKTFAGLKVQWLRITTAVGNHASGMTFKGGASNGYLLFGTSGLIVLYPGSELYLRVPDKLPDVTNSSTDTIDVSGTVTDSYTIMMVAG